MKVLKFGGTSVGSVKGLANVKRIVESAEEDLIVVVSALGGITDRLLLTARLASEGNEAYLTEYAEIVRRHDEVIDGIVPEAVREGVKRHVRETLGELENIYRGVYLIRDLSRKTSDTIVSYGERISSFIISHIIEGAELYDSCEFIKTIDRFDKHIVDFEATDRLISERFARLPRVAIVPGFISTDAATGDITNLGRGGSDYTASILAARLGASVLEIWTDVDGFMTADPRVINSAYVIDCLSFIEAMELCNFGAKVIYPPTIYPVYHKNIPIRVCNTFNPQAPGTLITQEYRRTDGKRALISGISSIDNTCLVTVQGLGMVGVIGVNHRIFKTLAETGVSVFMVSQASSENNTTFAVRNEDADRAVEALNKEFSLERSQGEINDVTAEKGLATVAIVGEDMKRTPGIAGRLFGTLGRAGISVIACAQGASETNISFVIKSDVLRKALNSIHDSFFLSEYKVLNLFIAGVGTVGGNLLEQIRGQQENLMKQNRLKLNIVGVANSRKMLLCRDGLKADGLVEALKADGVPSSPAALRDEILRMNIFNSVFVDCTSSEEVAALYESLLDKNISVVAANKIAPSSAYDRYRMLKDTARRRDVKFLFETNVGAGLPIIHTMNDLINSGDHIIRIEAVLSGTLNYIFNTIDASTPMSRAIRMAVDSGYAEPDPRVDLSGKDVVRKLVILAREAGYRVEQADVKQRLFIPEEYFTDSTEDFWARIPEQDAHFEAERKRLAAENKRLRFVARMADGVCEVGLEEVCSNHPFYELEGSNNIIMISTERYHDYPMIIKGYGAGADVTAAGVFADIISIANIR
ncbi:bifunctional aspartate kinase/homoserine dehydrogenase I [Tannerella sp. oral taxon 808]|nr:bifunctional aspartate kinase/homoserine dehydrogenase I [Tannerella sp. oral taxon 808]